MEAYIGQIQPFGFNFAPRGWSFCNGALVPIQQNTALFSLIGVTFGGDGRTTFGLPQLAGTAVCGTGQGPGLSQRFNGETFGTPTVTLSAAQIPAHTHAAAAVSFGRGQARNTTPSTDAALTLAAGPVYATGAPDQPMNPQAVGIAGGSQPHNNMQPYTAVNFCIATTGAYPSFD